MGRREAAPRAAGLPGRGEDAARRFWVDGLGLSEVAKPEDLVARGGAWFRAYAADGTATAEVHVGVEQPFGPARKAHPALHVGDVDTLDTIASRLRALGHAVERASATRSRATSACAP